MRYQEMVSYQPYQSVESQSQQQIFSSKEECEKATGRICSFQTCDYLPKGKTFEEVCGKDFRKGWSPTGQSLTSIRNNELSTWKTYKNDQYKFEFKYPDNWLYSSTGPNETMKQLLKGETISGTIQPSYDTIRFSDEKGNEVFDIEIFDYKNELSPKEYKEGYLYTLGPCDLRWGFTEDTVEIINKPHAQFLKVDGKLNSDKSPASFLTCYYTKNEEEKLLVLNSISNSSNKDSTLIDQILSTFKFIDSPDKSSKYELPVNKTTGWKIFNNGIYSFEVPSDFNIVTSDKITDIQTIIEPSFNSSLMTFSISVNQTMGLECGDIVNRETLTVSGIRANMAVWRGVDCGTGERSQIFMSLDKDNKHYSFTSTLKSGDEEKAEQIFKKIMNTFKFL